MSPYIPLLQVMVAAVWEWGGGLRHRFGWLAGWLAIIDGGVFWS